MSYPGRDAVYMNKVDGTHNFKNVIAKRDDLVRIDGGRLKPPAANGDGSVAYATSHAGLVLGYATTGGDAGLWKPYNDANSDGSQVARGVLEQTVTVASDGSGSEIGIIKSGTLYPDLLIGMDAAGLVDLKASTSVEHGVNLVTIYA